MQKYSFRADTHTGIVNGPQIGDHIDTGFTSSCCGQGDVDSLGIAMAKTLKRRSEVENPKYMKSLLAMLAYCFYLIIPIFGKVTLFTEEVIARRVILDMT